MAAKNFHEVVQLIRREDTRYETGAYLFMRHALDFTLSRIRETEKTTAHRHVTGAELCMGIRDYAIEQFGPMTYTLLENWGLRKTEDFGEIVFNLVEFGIFGKTDQDCREDFTGVYEFERTFKKPFEPSAAIPQRNPLPEGQPSENKK